jgi:hypothetical protein
VLGGNLVEGHWVHRRAAESADDTEGRVRELEATVARLSTALEYVSTGRADDPRKS